MCCECVGVLDHDSKLIAQLVLFSGSNLLDLADVRCNIGLEASRLERSVQCVLDNSVAIIPQV